MAKGVIILVRSANANVDAYNRKAINTSADIDNGHAVNLAFPTSGDVFTATVPSSDFKNVWIAATNPVNKLAVGQVYGSADARYFTNVKGKAFDVIKPMQGDVYQFSKDVFVENKDPQTVSNATVIELTSDGWEAKASATAQYAGVTLKIGRKEDMVFGGANIGDDMVDAWLVEVV